MNMRETAAAAEKPEELACFALSEYFRRAFSESEPASELTGRDAKIFRAFQMLSEAVDVTLEDPHDTHEMAEEMRRHFMNWLHHEHPEEWNRLQQNGL